LKRSPVARSVRPSKHIAEHGRSFMMRRATKARLSMVAVPLLLLCLHGCEDGDSDEPEDAAGAGGAAGRSGAVAGRPGTAGAASGEGGGGGSAGSGAAGEACRDLRAVPIDTSGKWCVASYEADARQVVGCVAASGCSDDYACVRRKSDGAVFVGFGTSCFDKASEDWEICMPRVEDFPLCSEVGAAGQGGQGGG
jgi:hypothetical protein